MSYDLRSRIILIAPLAYATLRAWSVLARHIWRKFAYANSLRHLTHVEFVAYAQVDMTRLLPTMYTEVLDAAHMAVGQN